MADEDNDDDDIDLDLNEGDDFLFSCEFDEFFINGNDLSEFDDDDAFVTNDVIVGGVDEVSFPILEHV
jgi:hypothetical protein